MKILLVGGTGVISTSVTERLIALGHEVTLLMRGNKPIPAGAQALYADINDEETVQAMLDGKTFDTVADFIVFDEAQLRRDLRLFRGHMAQYIFISTASAYQKPPRNCMIDESTPLCNPYWEYSRKKAACEDILMHEYRENGFPVTIVRPSHTYCERSLPVAIHGGKGVWEVLCRMQKGKPVLIPGDGATVWTVTTSKDFAVGFAGLCGNPHAIGEAVQITSDERLTWNMIHKTIADILRVPFIPCYVPSSMLAKAKSYDFSGPLLGDKANNAIFDNSKIKRLVPEFCAKTRFDTGARESIQYILNHKELQVPDPAFDDFCDKVTEIMRGAGDAMEKL